MAAAKKSSPARSFVRFPPALTVTLRWAIGPGRVVTLLLVIFGLFFGAWRWMWRSVESDVLHSPSARVERDDIEFTRLPPWIRDTSFRDQVFRVAVQDGPLWIHDENLIERLRTALALHPWDARVDAVEPRFPNKVRVDLVYRKPVCMVHVEDALIPVDAEGYVLPGDDFSPLESQGYPRVVGIEARPLVQVGARWNDARVSGAAEIAAALSGAWNKMGLAKILPSRLPELGSGRHHTYKVYTAKGNSIDWWHAPSGAPPSEPAAADKVAKLEKYFDEHGTLDGKYPLDVTRPNSIEMQIERKEGP
jgi:hypothetical protein